MKEKAMIYNIIASSKNLNAYMSCQKYIIKEAESKTSKFEEVFCVGKKIENFDENNRLFIEKEGKVCDFLIYVGSVIVPCVSKRFKEAMEELGINKEYEDIQFLPITLEKEGEGGYVIKDKYFMMNILNIIEGHLGDEKDFGKNKWGKYQDKIIIYEKLANNPKSKIFRITQEIYRCRIFVNAELRKLIEKDKRFFTGWVAIETEFTEEV